MTPFVGVRVLVVEDEGAVALLIEDMLEEFGCEVVASVARLAAARDMAGSVQVDLAILDVNLAGERVFFRWPKSFAVAIFPSCSAPDTAPVDFQPNTPSARSCTSRFRKVSCSRKIAVTLSGARESGLAASTDVD
nr:hypothetical protein GCM10020185_81160 [Pseudomonas brassicacearum subsp. brassicacearum]